MSWRESLGVLAIVGILFVSPILSPNGAALLESEETTLISHELELMLDGMVPEEMLYPSIDSNIEGMSPDNVKIPFGGFIENQGQIPVNKIGYYCSFEEGSIGFGISEISLRFDAADSEYLTLSFPGSNQVAPSGITEKMHKVNYYLGSLQLSNIPTFEEVWYYDIYDGIDLKYFMSSKGLKYEFIVHPQANSAQIQIVVDGDVRILIEDDIVRVVSERNQRDLLQDALLHVYQEDGVTIDAVFQSVCGGINTYSYAIGEYDNSQTLVIDPLILEYGTFIGGSNDDNARDLISDNDGNIYILGNTKSINFPITPDSDYDSSFNGLVDIVIVKMNPACDTLLYSTYFGGSQQDFAASFLLDSAQRVVVCGNTFSSDFPMVNPYDSTYSGEGDCYISRFTVLGGQLEFSTYIGGIGQDIVRGLAETSDGGYIAVGVTTSADFPMLNAIDDLFEGYCEGFVLKLDGPPNQLRWSTYFGGSGADGVYDVSIDGNLAYFVGTTNSPEIPMINPFDDSLSADDGVVGSYIISDASTYELNYCSYFGGSSWDEVSCVVAAGDGIIYISGRTLSTDLYTLNAQYDEKVGTQEDIFVSKINTTDNVFEFSTYYGADSSSDLYVDESGNCYISGFTRADEINVVQAYQEFANDDEEGFFAGFSSSGEIRFSSYIGTVGYDSASGLYVDASGNVHLLGTTESDDFPVLNGYDETHNGYRDIFLTKFFPDFGPPAITLVSPTNNTYHSGAITIDIDVTDENLETVLYSLSGYTWNYTWEEPYTKMLTPSEDGEIWLHVYAEDTNGQCSEAHYVFNFDITAPIIALENPSNNTVQHSGAVIDLQITDFYLTSVEYHWDLDSPTILSSPYQVILPSSPGLHSLFVQAEDVMGHMTAAKYVFTSNDTPPEITLISPSMAFKLYSGTCINLTVTPAGGTIDQALYNWDGHTNVSFSDPYDVYLPAGNGLHILSVYVHDTAGEWGSESFVFRTQDTVWLSFSTYLGGDHTDIAYDITVDDEGYVYLVGTTRSSNFPVKNAFNETSNYYDAFVTKFLPNGSDIVFSTYLGGADADRAYGVSHDLASNCYVTGTTTSLDFPLLNPYDSTPRDSFLSKFNKTGGLVFSTYFGGTDTTLATDIAVDTNGVIYIIGETNADDLPLEKAIDTALGGSQDTFITAFNQTGNGLVFSTYFGGEGTYGEHAKEIAIGEDGSIYVTGYTASTSFNTTPNAYDRIHNGAPNDGYLIILNATGTGLLYSTLFGGTGMDKVRGMYVYSDGRVLITGETDGDFPTLNAIQDTYGGGPEDGFILRFNSTLNGLDFSTYFGGANTDKFLDISVDIYGRIYAGGSSSSILQTYNALNDTFQGFVDAILLILNPSGNEIVSLSYYGGSEFERITKMFQDSKGNCYICGYTQSTDLPLKDAYQSTCEDDWNCFLVSLTIDDIAPDIDCTPASGSTLTSYEDIEVSVSDGISGLSHATYWWDEGLSITIELEEREDSFLVIPTGSDGVHVLHVLTNDTFGNTGYDDFVYMLDDSLPVISLMSPLNSTVQLSGTWINFEIDDLTVLTVQYLWEGDSSNTTLESPYRISLPSGDGTQILHIYATDEVGWSVHKMYVYFVDDTDVILDNLQDVVFQEGTTGHTLEWNPSDAYPYSFVIYLDDLVIQSGIWNSSSEVFTLNLDSLRVGTYNCYVEFYDTTNHMASDNVTITVVDEEAPHIEEVLDIEMLYGTAGRTIVWNPTDLYPFSYEIIRDGIPIESGYWTGESIDVTLDSLDAGVYNYTLIATDLYENSASDTVIVTVVDIMDPTIDHPIDVSYTEGETGNVLTWSPHDDNPMWYYIYRNGTEIEDQSWSGGEIAISVDFLATGRYNYTIAVIDKSGNSISDTVFITVLASSISTSTTETGTSTTQPPPDENPMLLIMLISGIGAAAVVVVIILLLKKRAS